tara:strand:+ start:3418 stop:3984 length:567 start_codon:yes stop_codon:yes gene_type:complete
MTWWRSANLGTGSKRGDAMVRNMQASLEQQYGQMQSQKQQADAARARYEQQTAAQTARYEQLFMQNKSAAETAQKQFAEQLEATKTANEATVAGLNNLLIEQKAATEAQATAFAEQTKAANARYEDQVARSARLATAYVPASQQTAIAPVAGDARVASQQVLKQNQLSNLSILNSPQRTAQLAGLQIA